MVFSARQNLKNREYDYVKGDSLVPSQILSLDLNIP